MSIDEKRKAIAEFMEWERDSNNYNNCLDSVDIMIQVTESLPTTQHRYSYAQELEEYFFHNGHKDWTDTININEASATVRADCVIKALVKWI